jgi:hypothetical protein
MDPIIMSDSTNLYEYVGNDPVNRFDPSGQQGVETAREARKLGEAGREVQDRYQEFWKTGDPTRWIEA